MESSSGCTIIDTPEGIRMVRLLALRGALKLEILGLRGRVNAYQIVKREFGFKGNRQAVYTQFCEYVEKEKGK